MKSVRNYIGFEATSEIDLKEKGLNEHSECQRNNEFILEISHALSGTCENGRGIDRMVLSIK